MDSMLQAMWLAVRLTGEYLQNDPAMTKCPGHSDESFYLDSAHNLSGNPENQG